MGILFHNRKQQVSSACNNLDGSPGSYDESKEPIQKDYEVYDYLSGKLLEMVNQLRARDRGGLVGGREECVAINKVNKKDPCICSASLLWQWIHKPIHVIKLYRTKYANT